MMTRPSHLPSGFSRRRFLALLGLGGIAVAGDAVSAEHPASEAALVIQQNDSAGACGPCSFANALLHGDPAGRRAFDKLPGTTAGQRVDALIARYGAKPSETYGKRRSRFVAAAGITAEDMPFLVNDLLADEGLPKARGDWLDLAANEDGRAHLQRLHGLFTQSLARGLPPMIEVRAFSADPGSPKEPWVNLYAHWLALVGVEPARLPVKASGFLCRLADSFTGREIFAFAYAESFRPFMATRGFTLKGDGTKDWRWLSGHPFILLDLPDVPLMIQTRPWHERTFVALTYMVHRAAV